MAIAVKTYALSWSIQTNQGAVFLQLVNGSQGTIRVDSAAELAALGDILRHSQGVGFDANGETLSTAPKPPGTS